MTQEDLKLKVINAEAKVAKRTAVLKKHREQLAKLIQKGADKFDISIKQSDIESAVNKLEEAKQILANWQAKLDERIAADDYLEANAPEILKDFLENWKQHLLPREADPLHRISQGAEGSGKSRQTGGASDAPLS